MQAVIIVENAQQNLFRYSVIINQSVKTDFSLSKKYFSTSCQTSRNTRRRGKSHRRRTKVRQVTLDKVSKNAFVEPIQALQNYYTENRKILNKSQNITCIFAVRGFIDSLQSVKTDFDLIINSTERLKWKIQKSNQPKLNITDEQALWMKCAASALSVWQYIMSFST